MGNKLIQYINGFLLLYGLVSVSIVSAAQETVNKALKEQLSAQQEGKQTQDRIDKLDEQTQAMFDEYQGGMIRLDDLKTYNQQMQHLMDDQKIEMDKKEKQMRDIVEMQQQLVPFLQQMVDVLAEFVSLDLPFLPEEREQRIEQLNQLLRRSDISVTEKYRRIMEAYRVEAEYGHTLESYQGTLNENEEARAVEFLRLGRAGLYYLSLKGDEGGFWLRQSQQWLALNAAQRESLANAIRVAKKQSPPDLVMLPVSAPEEVK